jgi:hypothetical protein
MELVQSCLDTRDIDRRIEMLERINDLLPKEIVIKIPFVITNDYINKALGLLEEHLTSSTNPVLE